MPHSSTSRRAFLRGAAGTLTLPLLPSLARAEEGTAPKRLVCVGTQLGWYKPDFFASNDDARLVQPLDQAGLKDDFTTIAGLDHKGPTGNGHALVYTLFTGQVTKSISLDQYVAPQLGRGARYESLQMTAGEQRNNVQLSHNANGIPLPPIPQPSVLYSRIFGGDAASQDRQRYLLESGRSLLDDVGADARRIGRRLSHEDGAKLDEYLTAVREVEKGLARRRDWMDKPYPDPGDFALPDSEDISEALMLQNEDLMWDLMALAIRNDTCRVFSLTITLTNSGLLLPDGKVTAGYHNLSHHGNKKEKVDELVAVEHAHMTGAARFLKALKNTADVDGSSMLDNTVLLVGSGMADAAKHRRVDLPLMVAGGGFDHQRHLDCGEGEANRNEMACDLFVTVLHRLGFDNERFATSTSNLDAALLS